MNKILKKLGLELLYNIKEKNNNIIYDKILEEKNIGIENTIKAMIEVGVPNDKIISMLQKYWDLRLSEATERVNFYKYK